MNREIEEVRIVSYSSYMRRVIFLITCDQFIKFNLWSNLLTNYSLNEHYSSIIPKLDIIPSLENLPISVKSSNYKINFYSVMLKKKEKTYLFYRLNGINFYHLVDSKKKLRSIKRFYSSYTSSKIDVTRKIHCLDEPPSLTDIFNTKMWAKTLVFPRGYEIVRLLSLFKNSHFRFERSKG